MARSRRAVVVAVVTFAVAAAGCSGSSSKSAGTTAQLSTTTTALLRLSKPDFIAQAETLCAAAANAINALGPPPDADNLAKSSAYIEREFAIVRDLTAKLKALPAPAADQAVVAPIYAGLDRIVQLEPQALALARANDRAGFRKLDPTAAWDDVNKRFDAYGLHTCAEG